MDQASYPILEFDERRDAIVRPELIIKPVHAPQRCVLCFFAEAIERLLTQYPYWEIGRLPTEGRSWPLYSVEYEGETLCLVQAQVGGPCAAAQMEELYAMGCRRFLACGSCGVLREDLPAGHIILPAAAIRDEGTSYHYLPPSRELVLDQKIVSAMEAVLAEWKIPYVTGKTWTTDAVYRETRARAKRRIAEGCVSVEMECATWAAVARYLGAEFGQILYAGDSLGGAQWDMRNFTRLTDVREQILQLTMSACLQIFPVKTD